MLRDIANNNVSIQTNKKETKGAQFVPPLSLYSRNRGKQQQGAHFVPPLFLLLGPQGLRLISKWVGAGGCCAQLRPFVFYRGCCRDCKATYFAVTAIHN
jgi:hypothetical protein